MSWSAVLTYGDTEIEIGDGSSAGGFNATSGGIEGWYSTPEAKWGLTEKTTGDGAYSLYEDDEVLYSARTVTLHLWAEGDTRREVVENKLALLGCAGQEVELQVQDGGYYTHVNGYATVEDAGGALSDRRDEMSVTIECPNPYRYLDLALLAEYTAAGTASDDFEIGYKTVAVGGANAAMRKYSLSNLFFTSDAYPVLHVVKRAANISYLSFEASTSEVPITASAEDVSLSEVYIDFRDGTACDGDGNDVSDLFGVTQAQSIEHDVYSDVTIIVNSPCNIELQFWRKGSGEKWL